MGEPTKLGDKLPALLARLAKPIGVTDADLQERDRKDHEAIQAGLLPMRLADWGVEHKERDTILRRPGANPWSETPAVKWVRWMHQTPKVRSLVLWGGTSAGKSIAAAYWLTLAGRRPIIGHPRLGNTWEWDPGCRFVSPGEIWRRYGSFAPEDRHWANYLRTARAVVLDDLGTSQYDIRGHVFDIVYERNRRELLTVATTNLDPGGAEFARRVDARVVERLRQDGKFAPCGDANLRGQP